MEVDEYRSKILELLLNAVDGMASHGSPKKKPKNSPMSSPTKSFSTACRSTPLRRWPRCCWIQDYDKPKNSQ